MPFDELQGDLFEPGVAPPADLGGPALHFAFRDDELLVRGGDRSARVPEVADFSELGVPFSVATTWGAVAVATAAATALP